jgi:hypothetical protein
MLSYAMPCYAMLCYAMLSYAILCYAMLCYARYDCVVCMEAQRAVSYLPCGHVACCGKCDTELSIA